MTLSSGKVSTPYFFCSSFTTSLKLNDFTQYMPAFFLRMSVHPVIILHNFLAISRLLYYSLRKQKVSTGAGYEIRVQSLYQADPPSYVPCYILSTPPCFIRSVGVSQMKGNLKKLLRLSVNASL